MKNEKVKVVNDLQFLIEDVDIPAALMELDGTICRVNDPFRKRFNADKNINIKNLDGISFNFWNDYLKVTKKKGYKTFEVDVKLQSTETYSIKVQCMLCRSIEKVLVFFNFPSIKELESRGSKIFRKSGNLMLVFDRQGVIQDANKLTYEYFNLPQDSLIGKKLFQFGFLFSVSSQVVEKYLQKVVTEGHVEVLKRFEHIPEVIRYFLITTFFDEKSNLFLMRLDDHTEKVALQKRLEHKESLSEIGELAASIAHEIRNPITTLKGFTQLLRNSTAEESTKYLTVIDDEINRIESILSEMLVLSKPRTEERKLISISGILSDMINVIYPKAHIDGISIIQSECDFPDVSIYGDEGKLKQVLLNILKNALEAMTSGGQLTIGVDVKGEEQVNLTISDTGKGMTVAQLKQIFMPFFTTRSEGTGLGLPFSIKTVEEHGGTISVSSEVGIGTQFTLSFPLSSAGVLTGIKELSQSVWTN